MSSCKKEDNPACSISLPKAKNPRNNPWIDHINKEAKRLGISYMSAVGDKRVRESYRILQNKERFPMTKEELEKKRVKKVRAEVDQELKEINKKFKKESRDLVRQKEQEKSKQEQDKLRKRREKALADLERTKELRSTSEPASGAQKKVKQPVINQARAPSEIPKNLLPQAMRAFVG